MPPSFLPSLPLRSRMMRNWGVIGGVAAVLAAGLYVLWGPLAERKRRRKGEQERRPPEERVFGWNKRRSRVSSVRLTHYKYGSFSPQQGWCPGCSIWATPAS